MLLTLLSPRRVLQALDGVLTGVGSLTTKFKAFVTTGGALTMSGDLSSRLLVFKALDGTLTGSATLATQYTPPPDLLLRLLRRNQTD